MVPIKDGTVQIHSRRNFRSSHPGSSLGLSGVGRVGMLGNMRASFMAKLTQDGSGAPVGNVRKDLAAIRIAYD